MNVEFIYQVWLSIVWVSWQCSSGDIHPGSLQFSRAWWNGVEPAFWFLSSPVGIKQASEAPGIALYTNPPPPSPRPQLPN